MILLNMHLHLYIWRSRHLYQSLQTGIGRKSPSSFSLSRDYRWTIREIACRLTDRVFRLADLVPGGYRWVGLAPVSTGASLVFGSTGGWAGTGIYLGQPVDWVHRVGLKHESTGTGMGPRPTGAGLELGAAETYLETRVALDPDSTETFVFGNWSEGWISGFWTRH